MAGLLQQRCGAHHERFEGRRGAIPAANSMRAVVRRHLIRLKSEAALASLAPTAKRLVHRSVEKPVRRRAIGETTWRPQDWDPGRKSCPARSDQEIGHQD